MPHPDIITESGRATVAYYSVLLFNILDVSRFEIHELPETLPDDAHELLQNLMEVVNVLDSQECAGVLPRRALLPRRDPPAASSTAA